ncbi:DUF4259 domain-containing protein [Tumidithrix helvetica PCC 7403]|uniref:DUF4259 domain-containing protein n=1 Tax=Tumidithrix helvetica TaxID=3457545 RepID=UPI003C90D60E
MGAWDTDPFGNDTAGDWTYDLEETEDLSLIKSTIQNLLDIGEDYLDASDAEEVIAAADTLARLKGNFYIRNAYTRIVDEWVAKYKLVPPQHLIDSAVQAIARILTPPSELFELWQETEDFEAWRNHLEELKQRLQ